MHSAGANHWVGIPARHEKKKKENEQEQRACQLAIQKAFFCIRGTIIWYYYKLTAHFDETKSRPRNRKIRFYLQHYFINHL